MKTIKQFPIDIEQTQHVDIPFNSEILPGILTSGKKPVLSVVVNDHYSDHKKRKLLIFTDGKEIPYHLNRTNFIGQFEYNGKDIGTRILYVFEDMT